MPPAIYESDDGSDDLDTIPAKPVTKAKPKGKGKGQAPVQEDHEDEVLEDAPEPAGDEEDGDDDGEDEETYVVEKITEHEWSDAGKCLYKVKWLGYEKANEMTWEPEENLTEGASDILSAYHKKIGGRPTAPTTAKGGRGKRKRSLSTSVKESPAPTSAKKGNPKKTKTNGTEVNGKTSPPLGLWENEVERISTIEEVTSKEEGGKVTGELQVYLQFNNGHKGAFKMQTVRQKCPQKLLDYYEQHLSFKGPAEEFTDTGADE